MAVSIDNVLIGKRIKDFRLEKNLTLAEAAETIKCSPSLISLVENGRCGISLTKLQKLLFLYGKTMGDLVKDGNDEDESNKHVVNLANAQHVTKYGDDVEMLLLAHDIHLKMLEPAFFRLLPKATLGPLSHIGEEFIFVLEGTLEARIENTETGEISEYTIQQYDSMYYESSCLHTFHNPTDKPASFIGVGTPPSF